MATKTDRVLYSLPLLQDNVNVNQGSELDDLKYDLMFPAAFFERPLTLEAPHLQSTVQIGDGLGGFSALYFQRHYTCTLCGKCCKDNVRGSWFWFPWEPCPGRSPSGVPFGRETIRVNGISFDLQVYRNRQHPTICEFLKPLSSGNATDGTPLLGDLWGCSLHHTGEKNTLCRTFLDLFPQWKKEARSNGCPERLYFSKRLGSRNWRKPQCPAEWTSISDDDGQRDWDDELMWRYAKLIEEVPGNLGWEIWRRYRRLYDPQTFFTASGGSQLITFEQVLKLDPERALPKHRR